MNEVSGPTKLLPARVKPEPRPNFPSSTCHRLAEQVSEPLPDPVPVICSYVWLHYCNYNPTKVITIQNTNTRRSPPRAVYTGSSKNGNCQCTCDHWSRSVSCEKMFCIFSLINPSVRADLGGHLKYSQRWSGVHAGVLLGAQGAVRRGESRGGL